ncbi:MAG TPA: hypothetical protein VG798_03145 [Rhizomicrobium sp.]|nr:hypothetical protein [Rhizomicrobium sp.]
MLPLVLVQVQVQAQRPGQELPLPQVPAQVLASCHFRQPAREALLPYPALRLFLWAAVPAGASS